MRALIILSCSIALFLVAGSDSANAAAPRLLCGEAPCHFRMQGGSFHLRFIKLKISCREVGGVGEMESSGAATTTITFSGCREEVTPFVFGCVNASGQLGTIETNELGTAAYEEGRSLVLQLDGLDLSFVCGGLEEPLHIEGFFTADLAPRACEETARRFPLPTELIGHGREAAGPNYDVYVNGFGGEEYEFTPPWLLMFRSPSGFAC